MLKARVAVLVSGNGTNLQALLDQEKKGNTPHAEIALVIADNAHAKALERASRFSIKHQIIPRENFGKNYKVFEEELLAALRENKIDLLVLAGFLGILSKNFFEQFRGPVINIHPSLIPAFCGKGFYGLHVHEAALEAGVKVSGATVHYVNEVVDGGKIIVQRAVKVQADDTPQSLQKRIMQEAEWILLPQSTELVAKNIVEHKHESAVHTSLSKSADKAPLKSVDNAPSKSAGKVPSESADNAPSKGADKAPIKDADNIPSKSADNTSINIENYLASKPYPGRGILVGVKNAEAASSPSLLIAYFIMGRSSNSQNRIFEETKDGIRTAAFDESKLEDPSLIIYHPVRHLSDGQLIVSNGDQTDTIRDYLVQGKTFEEALRTRTFEPDEPNWTPRISALMQPDGSYALSILKSGNGNPHVHEHFFFTYEGTCPGTGHFISTYAGDGSPVPSFSGEPLCVDVPWRSAAETAQALWKALDASNKVSLYVEEYPIKKAKTPHSYANESAVEEASRQAASLPEHIVINKNE